MTVDLETIPLRTRLHSWWNWIYVEIIDRFVMFPLWKLGLVHAMPICVLMEEGLDE